MTVIKAIGPILMVIALLAPIITGYRKERLGTSIKIGWGTLVFASFLHDGIIPELSGLFCGREAALEVTPNTPSTVGMMMVGWLYPLILHFVGCILCAFVDALRGLLSKARHH